MHIRPTSTDNNNMNATQDAMAEAWPPMLPNTGLCALHVHLNNNAMLKWMQNFTLMQISSISVKIFIFLLLFHVLLIKSN